MGRFGAGDYRSTRYRTRDLLVIRNKNYDPGWVSCLREGAFSPNFSISVPEFLILMLNLSLGFFFLTLVVVFYQVIITGDHS